MSVIKNGKTFKNLGAQPQTGGGLSPGPSVGYTAPAWPPNSSDLKPVDYAIWDALQQMVYHRQNFASVDELKRTIVEAWQKLPQSFIDKSVGEWHRRLD